MSRLPFNRLVAHRGAVPGRKLAGSRMRSDAPKISQGHCFIQPMKLMNGSKAEIREMAARICRDYLHGSWRQVTGKDIGLTRVTGGLSNWLYHVSLPSSLPPRSTEPPQVLLRLYGQMHGERALEGLITESVIFTLLSERRLGPMLHGVFPGGRIEEYIDARPVLTRELRLPKLSQLIGRKMAAIHEMNVPITKEPVWLWETMCRWLQAALENLNSPGRVAPDDQAAVARLQTYDLQAEVDWISERVRGSSYPVVFCHNDLQCGNILLHLDPNRSEAEILADPSLVLIDFEYCSYNYRGFDLANHFNEWMYDYTNEAHPYFTSVRSDYPSVEQKLVYIRGYLSHLRPDLRPDEATLLREVEVFTLLSHLLWGLWGVVNAKLSDINFGYWDYGLERIATYMSLKAQSPFGTDLAAAKSDRPRHSVCSDGEYVDTDLKSQSAGGSKDDRLRPLDKTNVKDLEA